MKCSRHLGDPSVRLSPCVQYITQSARTHFSADSWLIPVSHGRSRWLKQPRTKSQPRLAPSSRTRRCSAESKQLGDTHTHTHTHTHGEDEAGTEPASEDPRGTTQEEKNPFNLPSASHPLHQICSLWWRRVQHPHTRIIKLVHNQLTGRSLCNTPTIG